MTKRITAVVVAVVFSVGALAPVGSAQYTPYAPPPVGTVVKKNCKKKAKTKVKKIAEKRDLTTQQKKKIYRKALRKCKRSR